MLFCLFHASSVYYLLTLSLYWNKRINNSNNKTRVYILQKCACADYMAQVLWKHRQKLTWNALCKSIMLSVQKRLTSPSKIFRYYLVIQYKGFMHNESSNNTIIFFMVFARKVPVFLTFCIPGNNDGEILSLAVKRGVWANFNGSWFLRKGCAPTTFWPIFYLFREFITMWTSQNWSSPWTTKRSTCSATLNPNSIGWGKKHFGIFF